MSRKNLCEVEDKKENTIEEKIESNQLKKIDTIREQIKNTLYYPFGGIAIFSYEYYKYNPDLYLEIFIEESD